MTEYLLTLERILDFSEFSGIQFIVLTLLSITLLFSALVIYNWRTYSTHRLASSLVINLYLFITLVFLLILIYSGTLLLT